MIINNINSGNMNDVFEVIHEVKNSIAVCCGYLDIIDYSGEGDMNKYISIMRKEINRSMEIIGEFMLYRQIMVCKNIMDINELIKEVCNDIGGYVGSKEISFNYEILDEKIYIDGDYNKLKQVFINLIKNGVESINKSDGNIRLFGYVKDNFYYSVIRDNGCGMDSDVLNKVMVGGFTSKIDGNGVGVKFCKKIIMEHNGSIDYESVVGSGTKVIVKLPIVMI